MKVLKGLFFLLLAVLVFCGFITAYSTVPKRFEESAREQTLARIEQTGTVVDESYVNATIEKAIRSNLYTIYRTAILVSLAAALAICMFAFRPPHDCGGLNLFNPLAIPLIALIVISTAVGISLALSAVQGQSVAEFRQIVDELCRHQQNGTSEGDRLILFFLIPLALEAIFRGYIFSFLEKLHFTVAIVLSTAAYALVAYYCVYSYAERSIGSTAAAAPAMFIALAIGLVLSIVTWRLRSCIPALLGHVFIANSGRLVERICESKYVNLPVVIIVLAGSLALLVFLPVLLAKKAPLFAYDYPFTEHHKRMAQYLETKRRSRKRKSAAEDSDAEPAKAAAKKKPAKAAAKKKPAEAAEDGAEENHEDELIVAEFVDAKAGSESRYGKYSSHKKAKRPSGKSPSGAKKSAAKSSGAKHSAEKASGKKTSGAKSSGSKSSGKKNTGKKTSGGKKR